MEKINPSLTYFRRWIIEGIIGASYLGGKMKHPVFFCEIFVLVLDLAINGLHLCSKMKLNMSVAEIRNDLFRLALDTEDEAALRKAITALKTYQDKIRKHSHPNIYPPSSKTTAKVIGLQDSIRGFGQLRADWDSYHASAISPKAIAMALKACSHLKAQNFLSEGVEINVFPMRDGGVQFEFDAEDLCAELEINDLGELGYIQFDEVGNIIKRVPLTVV